MNVYVLRAIEVIALSVVMFFSTMLTSREMTKRDYKYPRWLPYAVSEGGLVLLFLLGGFSVWTFRGCALLLILLFASIQDHSTHEADDVLSVMIFLLAIIVRIKDDERYEIVSGHRRVHACKLLGVKTIPATTSDNSVLEKCETK